MSDVKRYDFVDYEEIGEVEDGTYVLASDYDFLAAREALTPAPAPAPDLDG